MSLPSTSGYALLKKQRIIYDVYSAFQRENQIEALESILFVKNIGADTLVAGLEVIPELWRPKETSDSILSALCVLYIDISLKIGLVEPQVSAIQNLADIMDHLLKQGQIRQASRKPTPRAVGRAPLTTNEPSTLQLHRSGQR